MTIAPPARVTIADVARSAGVSVPTVSKVLNRRADVAPETRARVERALDDHRYRRRGTGRRPSPPVPGAGAVELVLTHLDSAYALEVIAGAEEGAARTGTPLVVTAAHDPQRRPREWVGPLAERSPAGVVVVLNHLSVETVDDLEGLGCPVVLLDPVGGTDPGIPTVGATNFAGGVAATEHLLALGHERVAVVTGLPGLVCSRERLEGYRAAMARVGLAVDEALVHHGDFQPGGGHRAACALLALDEPPTAVFAGSDMQASGVYRAAREHGLHVPQDLSVVGFDDVSLAQHLSPPLTTVRQPLADMAGEAVRMVTEIAEHGPSRTPPHLQLATSLVVRESTARP